MFRRNVLPPCSGSKSKTSKKQQAADVRVNCMHKNKFWYRQWVCSHWFSQKFPPGLYQVLVLRTQLILLAYFLTFKLLGVHSPKYQWTSTRLLSVTSEAVLFASARRSVHKTLLRGVTGRNLGNQVMGMKGHQHINHFGDGSIWVYFYTQLLNVPHLDAPTPQLLSSIWVGSNDLRIVRPYQWPVYSNYLSN
jgi:hypothetical protein